MKTGYLKYALAAVVATASTPILANGLALNEQSASTAGTAYAGRASSALDASTIYGNPAGMSRLERPQVTAGAAVIVADTDISETSRNTAAGSTDGDMVPTSVIPFGYYAHPLNDKLALGIGLYAPFGAETDYEDSFAGRAHGLQSKIQVITLQPTISYAITDRVSVGAGITFNRIDGKLTSAPSLPVLVGGDEFNVDVEGDDESIGFNLGVLVAITDNLDWGITYHSKLDFELSGETEVSGMAGPGPIGSLNGTYDGRLSITMPESVDTSLTYRMDQWTFFAGVTWTRWSRLEGITIHNDGVPQLPGLLGGISDAIATSKSALNWEDTWSYAVGTSYQLNPEWILRAGYAFDESPTNDEHRTVRIPVSDRNILTVGAGWTPTPNLTIDMAYAYIMEDEGLVEKETFSADYENTAHAFSAQMTYRF